MGKMRIAAGFFQQVLREVAMFVRIQQDTALPVDQAESETGRDDGFGAAVQEHGQRDIEALHRVATRIGDGPPQGFGDIDLELPGSIRLAGINDIMLTVDKTGVHRHLLLKDLENIKIPDAGEGGVKVKTVPFADGVARATYPKSPPYTLLPCTHKRYLALPLST